MKYIKIRRVQEILQCSVPTIDRYCKMGKLHPVKTSDSKNASRLFDEAEVYALIGSKGNGSDRITIAYLRSDKEKKNFKDQQEAIDRYAMGTGLTIDRYIQEAGSGINSNRKELNVLIGLIESDMVKKVIITNRDRVLRVGWW